MSGMRASYAAATCTKTCTHAPIVQSAYAFALIYKQKQSALVLCNQCGSRYILISGSAGPPEAVI